MSDAAAPAQTLPVILYSATKDPVFRGTLARVDAHWEAEVRLPADKALAGLVLEIGAALIAVDLTTGFTAQSEGTMSLALKVPVNILVGALMAGAGAVFEDVVKRCTLNGVKLYA